MLKNFEQERSSEPQHMCKMKFTCIAKHLVFDNNLVSVQCLCIQFVGMILIGQIEQHLNDSI